MCHRSNYTCHFCWIAYSLFSENAFKGAPSWHTLIFFRSKRQILRLPIIPFKTLQHCYSGLDCVPGDVCLITGQGHCGSVSTYLPLHHHHLEIMLLLFTLNRLHTLLLRNQAVSPHPLHAPPHKDTPTTLFFTCTLSKTLLQLCTLLHPEACFMLAEKHALPYTFNVIWKLHSQKPASA